MKKIIKTIKKNKIATLTTMAAIGLIFLERKTAKENSRLKGIISNQDDMIRGYKKTTESMIFNAGKKSRAL